MIGKVRKGNVQVIKDITEITLRVFNKKNVDAKKSPEFRKRCWQI